ncbi:MULTISPECIES: sporulation protein YqfD [Oceanobacillus]|uniref:Sporulation protein YqfD n=1 Tax=Oceanobacillus kimchii TaxID=746691 RepID=A0ABQ5TLW1_9BACI|nr:MULTISPECIES: sporulation protein YqfD [Oceanobacillus]MBT2598290.1 sporulation protein YqfD [Oceanobacillus sp. ISL-74]MBT2651209.1 sporulation protein YqfD [Oceanobacillus sp. ISL-73]GLO66613.1 sporulation protein YqfD [Oceanobacillus kimchii]
MKRNYGKRIRGYVTVRVSGEKPELFFQKCANEGILIWDVKKVSSKACIAKLKLQDIKKLKQLRRRTIYKISFEERKGLPFGFSRFLKKRFLVIGIIGGVLFFLFLSNLLWSVNITGVPKEIEEKIKVQLDSYGIHPGVWLFSVDTPKDIQRNLLDDVPELLWAGVELQGTTLYLEGVEKIIVEELDPGEPGNIVAAKEGVITRMYVSKGEPVKQINDYVKPGDLLVSGDISYEEDQDEDENESDKNKTEPIAAEAEIFANTWYEVTLTVPLSYNYEQLTGNNKNKYYMKMGQLQFPIWGFRDPDFKQTQVELNEKPIQFLKWQLPISIIESEINEKQLHEGERTKEEAIEAGKQQAVKQLENELGPDAEILSEKVLHERIEHGKVKLIVYVSVEENIVKNEPIRQGD